MARASLKHGERIGERYVVEARIALGGMASVYRVRHLATGASGAMKILLAEALIEPALRDKFLLEARVGSSIDSEHVVRVTDAGVEADGTPWLVMELLEGETLAERLQRAGPLDPSSAQELLGQVAHALDAAHRAGVVHRDVKPSNVFIARSSRVGARATVKVLDFGIASVLSASRTTTLRAGTPGWMAPEQALSGVRVTPAADVWAFGLLAFEALVGAPYFDDEHPAATVMPAASSRAIALRGNAPLPEGFDPWFARCVAWDPSRRFQDIASAFESLRSPTTRRASRLRRRIAPALALVALGALTAAALGRLTRGATPPTGVRPEPSATPAPGVPAGWLAAWGERVRRASTLRESEWAALYTDEVDHGGAMPRARVADLWRARERLALDWGGFAFDPTRAQWTSAPPARRPRTCRAGAPGAEVFVARFAARNPGDIDAVGARCSPMEGTYRLYVRVEGESARVCAEAWERCDALCARCPTASRRRWGCCRAP